ncbi:MAG: antibiotic biosynthesis monooxygenase [Caulobacterales bacterium]|nr:antibiotic biosynthesis monooxygenase [Caulobacterales bacterium]
MLTRRAATAAALATLIPGAAMAAAPEKYGLFGKMVAAPGKRDELIGHLLAGTGQMPGCLIYVVARDPVEADAIWISEVWTDRQHHADSLKLPRVQAAIAKARPIIAGFGERFETIPVGGVGL